MKVLTGISPSFLGLWTMGSCSDAESLRAETTYTKTECTKGNFLASFQFAFE